MTADEIVAALAKSKPIASYYHGTDYYCAVCDGESTSDTGDDYERVPHREGCAWIAARSWAEARR